MIVGRGAVNQKGPEAAFLAALHAYRCADFKLPLIVAFVAEGEEEIGSRKSGVFQVDPGRALQVHGCLHAEREKGLDGNVTLTLGAEGRDRARADLLG